MRLLLSILLAAILINTTGCTTLQNNRRDIEDTAKPLPVLYSPKHVTLPSNTPIVVLDGDREVQLTLTEPTSYIQISEYALLEQKYLILLSRINTEQQLR